jgi:SAM-dependent methyltransferase
MPPPYQFPPKTCLQSELGAAMKRMGSLGITYPEGYYDRLVEKYKREEVLYPFALMLAGTPQLQDHFAYPRVLQRTGRILDYGCGCGDSVRALIHDGFPREKITAFDIAWSGINLGFDLYLDRGDLFDLFVVSETFPFGPAEFDVVHSCNVIHCIADDEEFRKYLGNTYTTLRPGGIFFGTTMGTLEEGGTFSRDCGLQRLPSREDLIDSLTGAGFIHPEVTQRPYAPGFVLSLITRGLASGVSRAIIRYLFTTIPVVNNYNKYIFRFSAEKPAESRSDR